MLSAVNTEFCTVGSSIAVKLSRKLEKSNSAIPRRRRDGGVRRPTYDRIVAPLRKVLRLSALQGGNVSKKMAAPLF